MPSFILPTEPDETSAPRVSAPAEPAMRGGMVVRFGAWLGTQRVTVFGAPGGLWLLVNALVGRYTAPTGVLGAIILAMAFGPPREDAGEEAAEEHAASGARRIARLLRGMLWLASPVLLEWWWVRNFALESGAWVVGLLVAAYAIHPYLQKLDRRRGGPQRRVLRRPVLGAGARVATVLAGSVTAMAGMILTLPERMPSAAGGILLMLLGVAMVVMGGLGLPTVPDGPRLRRASGGLLRDRRGAHE